MPYFTYLCIMKRITAIIYSSIILAACNQVVEHPLPPQMTCAQREMDEHHDGVFALYLLSELDDSIGKMPDYIQTRYEMMKSEAEKMKQIQPVYQYRQNDLYDVIRQRDSLFQRQLCEEREAYELQMRNYRENIRQSHSLLLLSIGILLGIATIFTIFWLRRERKKDKGQKAQDNNKKPAFSEIILHMGKLADMGGQPTADDWEKLHQHILTLHPNWQHRHNLEGSNITPQELQLCLLSTTPLRPKQISTLLGVSQQNLRNMRVRLYTRITGQPCTGVEQFTRWINS